jgi:hypothetical protein
MVFEFCSKQGPKNRLDRFIDSPISLHDLRDPRPFLFHVVGLFFFLPKQSALTSQLASNLVLQMKRQLSLCWLVCIPAPRFGFFSTSICERFFAFRNHLLSPLSIAGEGAPGSLAGRCEYPHPDIGLPGYDSRPRCAPLPSRPSSTGDAAPAVSCYAPVPDQPPPQPAHIHTGENALRSGPLSVKRVGLKSAFTLATGLLHGKKRPNESAQEWRHAASPVFRQPSIPNQRSPQPAHNYTGDHITRVSF